MNNNSSNVVGMCFEGRDLLGGIVVVDSELEVIRTTSDPVLARNEAPGSYGDICELKCFDNCLQPLSILTSSKRNLLHPPESQTTIYIHVLMELSEMFVGAVNARKWFFTAIQGSQYLPVISISHEIVS